MPFTKQSYNYNLPMIGIGTGGMDYNTTYNALLQALKIGYRLIDTAENYYNEEAVGDAIVDSGIDRCNIIIISKYFGGGDYGNPNDVIIHFNNSLKKLRTHYIDIYLVHMPCGCTWTNQWQPITNNIYENYKKRYAVWLQFVELKKKHLVNYIGVSNWTLHNINELLFNNLYVPDIIQIEWCPSYHDMELYDFCVKKRIRIIAYGLFSRNISIPDIELYGNSSCLCESSIGKCLIKWCSQRNIITIIRSTNSANMLYNFNAIQCDWVLNEESMKCIDDIPQQSKGHSLKLVYDTNHEIHLWKPFILDSTDILNNIDVDIDKNCKINDLIQGNISCIIVKNALNINACNDILQVFNNTSLFENHNTYFRNNEIGITIDNLHWRENPDHYWNVCIQINELFEKIFDSITNPFDIIIDFITKLSGNQFIIKRFENNGILCPKGVCRIFTPQSHEFPYHTDGFNYGNILNTNSPIKKTFSIMNDMDTHSVIAIIFVLQNTSVKHNEIDLFNCLVDDLELHKDEIGMYSHWMGTKYNNTSSLEKILLHKPYYSPILNKGDLYIFSASRIHKLHNYITNENRIVIANFALVKNNEIILYQ